jgi:endonuclease/exonuclease/phosphatase family metal-dependent hydrolase
MRPLKVVSYNIHRCYGVDGRYDPRRIAAVLMSLDADVIGLQEVDTSLFLPEHERRHPHAEPAVEEIAAGHPAAQRTQLQYLAESLGMQAVEGFVHHSRWGLFGNALLTRHDVFDVKRIDLTVRGASERRGALDVGLKIEDKDVRVIVTHLGLHVWERHFQITRLLKALGQDRTPYLIMMGDFNLWVSMLPKLRRFYGRLGHAPIARTFPSRFPFLSLDRIWVQPFAGLKAVEACHTPMARLASDHLPLVATVDFLNGAGTLG